MSLVVSPKPQLTSSTRAGGKRLAPEQLVTVTCQAKTHDLSKAAEVFEQHGVPRFDRNGVVGVARPGAPVVQLAALECGEIDGGRVVVWMFIIQDSS